jgi:hypothetical protein
VRLLGRPAQRDSAHGGTLAQHDVDVHRRPVDRDPGGGRRRRTAPAGRRDHQVVPRAPAGTEREAGGDVTLFTAPRAGASGRDGNTVGTYVCDDLACPATTRLERATPSIMPDLSHPLDERVAGLRVRLDTFLASIRGTVDAV